MTHLDPARLMEPAVDTLPINFAILDDEGTIIRTNRAWQEFATANDLRLRPDTVGTNYVTVTERDRSESGQAAAEGLKAVLDGEKTLFTLEYPCHSPEEKRWFTMRAAPFTVDDTRFVAVAHIDITDRKLSELETEAQARALDAQRRQLTLLNRLLRHDIRNDMTVVLGWGEELTAHVDESGTAMLDRIIETGQHVVDLTMTIRDAVEALAGDEDPPLQPVSLREYLAMEVEKVRSRYPEATVAVTDPVPTVEVVGNDLLSSVFRNVLNNAIQHNDRDTPHVEVSIDAEADAHVVVRIADNGPGIPTETREAIFGRAEEGLEHPAAGLGLHLVDQLVAAYGGTIEVADNEPRGSVFSITLPIA